jgi:hypothetical protein
MMTTVRWLILGSLILIAAGVAYDAARDRSGPRVLSAASNNEPTSTIERGSIWTGSASCVGRSCHGGIEPRTGSNCRQDEYTLILNGDPHTKAYRVLTEERSKDMVRRLGRADGNAHEDARCLSCHATPLTVSEELADGLLGKLWEHSAKAPESLRRAELNFGVGCESCHGAAVHWLQPHQNPNRVPKDPPKSIRDDGTLIRELFKEAKSWPQPVGHADDRAKVCASCHVGAAKSGDSGERSVDHDLIAAGHPRLLFEFVSLQDALPAHWRPRPRDRTYEWFIGQIEGTRMALDVLTDRASSPRATWPEFAEFSCFACHHDLKRVSWRQRLTFGAKHKPGTLPWNSWNDAVMTRLLKQHDLPTKEWDQLREAMMSFAAPSRVLELVEAAKGRLKELGAQADEWRQSKSGPAKLQAFLESPDWKNASSWEAAEQYYFALMVLKAVSDDPALVRRLTELEARRGFEDDFASPRHFDPAAFFKDAPK